MLIEYYKKRNARLKGDICFYNGAGTNIILALGEPQEIDDQWGYRLLAENADILRLVEKPKATPTPEPMPEASGSTSSKPRTYKKKSKK